MAGALETHLPSLSDSLIDGMSFANRSTASYITARKSTSFQTQSGGTFSPANLRILRFNLADSEGAWMDGSVLRVALTLNNTGTSQLVPTTNSPSSLFRRVRLLCGGTEIYDLLDYGRVHQQMTFQLPAARLRLGSDGYIELAKYAVARLYTSAHRCGHREAYDVSIDVPVF